MSRLPTPGQDNGNWGEILNDFLDQSHNADGSLKESAIPKSTNVTTDGSSDSKVPSVKAVKTYTDSKVGEVNTQLAAIAERTKMPDPLTITSAALLSGEKLELENNSISKNKTLAFSAKITSFDSLLVGHGKTVYEASYVVISSDVISIYSHATSPTLLSSHNHGLTISDKIDVVISVDNPGNADITITTIGGSFSVNAGWNGTNGAIFAESSGSVLSNCVLNWTSRDYSKPIYAFGDSYLSVTATSGWPRCIREMGFDNWLLDAYPGKKSNDALRTLQLALTHGTPRYVLWAMGMNDGDTASINTEWLSATTGMLVLCTEKGITPVLCTIPNVPQTTNVHKNAWVRASGHRYIDFSDAVNTDIDSNWYAGMLSEDNLHPSALGAMALAMRALRDMPEILLNRSTENKAQNVVELVNTITVDIEQQTITLELDSKGNPFQFADLSIGITMPGQTVAYTMFVRAFYAQTQFLQLQFSHPSTSSIWYARARMRSVDALWEISGSAEAAGGNPAVTAAPGNNYTFPSTINYKCVNRVDLVANGEGNVIPAGTVIKVYGKRA